jgi:hypothetical protein
MKCTVKSRSMKIVMNTVMVSYEVRYQSLFSTIRISKSRVRDKFWSVIRNKNWDTYQGSESYFIFKAKSISNLLIGVGSVAQENVHNLCVTLGSREVEGRPLVLVRTPSHRQTNRKHSNQFSPDMNRTECKLNRNQAPTNNNFKK